MHDCWAGQATGSTSEETIPFSALGAALDTDEEQASFGHPALGALGQVDTMGSAADLPGAAIGKVT